jgi:hypothetical protein
MRNVMVRRVWTAARPIAAPFLLFVGVLVLALISVIEVYREIFASLNWASRLGPVLFIAIPIVILISFAYLIAYSYVAAATCFQRIYDRMRSRDRDDPSD